MGQIAEDVGVDTAVDRSMVASAEACVAENVAVSAVVANAGNSSSADMDDVATVVGNDPGA